MWVLITGGLTAISFFTFNGCSTTETGRKQLNFVSQEQETQLGLAAFDQMKTNTPISKNADYNALVSRVGSRIAAQAADRLPNAQWEFVVFESPEANAFCLPGGKVGVYTGLIPIAKTEAGLATVIGHEVAHASQHHGAERMSDAALVQKGSALIGQAVSAKYESVNPDVAAAVLGGAGKYAIELPFSRTQESEADHVGLLYMAKAGYDPEEAVRFWERFSASHGGQGADSGLMAKAAALLRTHPVDAKRIADLKAWMPEAKAAFQGAKVSGAAPEAPTGKGATVISK